MINKTITKIKEYAEAIASIAKDFATAIVSIFAAITASITGYREVKKLVKTKPEVSSVNSTENISRLSNSGVMSSSTTTTMTITTTSTPQLPYAADYNTLFFGLAISFLFGTFVFTRIKKKRDSK